MKRILALILSAILIFSFAGCKRKDKAPDPLDYEFVINTQYIADLTAEYLTSESYLKGVAEFESHTGTRSGALLEKAMEYHLSDINGFSIDGIVLQLRSDVGYGKGELFSNPLVFIDLNTGEVTDNICVEFNEYINSYTADITGYEQLRSVIMNGFFNNDDPNPSILFHDQEIKKILTAEEVSSVNETLGLSYRGYESSEDADEGVDEETGSPIISTDAQERIRKITELAAALLQSPAYQEAALDPTTISVSAAMEYKHDTFAPGFPVHILMLHTDNINEEMYGFLSGTALMDMNTGAVYTSGDFDFNSLYGADAAPFAEDVFPRCMMAYESILVNGETQLWASMGETIINLTEEELAAVNETLGSANVAANAEKDALRLEAAKNLTEQQKLFFDAAVEFSKTPRYKEAAKNPASIRIANAAEYSFVHPENGFMLHVILLQADGIDVDMYGFSAGIFLKDLNTGTGCTDTFMDLNNWAWDWEDYSDINNVYAACILCFESAITNHESHLFMDDPCDQFTPSSKADLDAINAALNP